MKNKLRVLVVGCGNMGKAHSLAYDRIDEYEIVGLVSENLLSRRRKSLAKELGGLPEFTDCRKAIKQTSPDIISINTYAGSHFKYVMMAFEYGCDVFVEKPLATNLHDAKTIVKKAIELNRKIVVGYILRHHPSWKKIVEISHILGTPLVMRMNLNQCSSGNNWETHKKIIETASPLIDCGVHYVDQMCLMAQSPPVYVHAVGTRLSDEINPDKYNYGQLQVVFKNGSIGWYEAGWGPMISQKSNFIKDIFGPKGGISLEKNYLDGESDKVKSHVNSDSLSIYMLDDNAKKENWKIKVEENLDHNELCLLEQKFLLKVIKDNINIEENLNIAIDSLKIVLAADSSIREKRVVYI